MNLSGLAKLALIPFIGLGLGCTKEILYDGSTSFGKTKIVKTNFLFLENGLKQTIIRNDSTYTLFDKGNWGKLGDNIYDYVEIKSKNTHVNFKIDEIVINGKTYSIHSRNRLEKDIVIEGRNILKGKYDSWYQDINEEVSDSLRVRDVRARTKERKRLMGYIK